MGNWSILRFPNLPCSLKFCFISFEESCKGRKNGKSLFYLNSYLLGVDSGAGAFRRVHQNEDQVTVVKQMPRVETAMQPTIAVITSQYHEKMAVDSVMTNKQTFVRYATVGK